MLKTFFFSLLDGTNTIVEGKNGLQRQIRNESPHNIYVASHNHQLALCLPHLMKDKEFVPLLAPYHNFFLRV